MELKWMGRYRELVRALIYYSNSSNRGMFKKTLNPVMNSTPFVRQYGILLTNGVLLYAKREAKQEIHRGV